MGYVRITDLKSAPSSMDEVMLMGFVDELQKIAGIAPGLINAFGPTKTHDVQKRRSLTSPAKRVSMPQGPSSPTAPTDPLSSTRSTPPPPVTSG